MTACQARPAHIIEANLARQRTREGMAIVKSKGKLRGKQPTLSTAQQ